MESGDVILGDKQFNKCCNLHSVTIQSIIENETKTPTQVEFGQNCFSGATNLKKNFIEGGNIKINKQCFNGCQSLASHSFYKIESLSIGNKEFQNFRSLTSLEIDAKSNISLGSYCFSGSKNQQSVKIHGCGSVSLGYSCFYDCSSLLKVEFSQILRLTLDKYAFYHCNSLGGLIFDDVLRINIDDYGFNGTKIVDLKMTRAENIIIGKECFKGCSSISSFLICDADDVKICQNAFEGCTNLKTLDIEAKIEFKAENNCFYKATCLQNVKIISNMINLGDCCFKNCNSLKVFQAPTVNEFMEYKNSFCNVSSDIKYELNPLASKKTF